MNKKRLGERLLESGVISGSELEQALAHQKKTKKRLGETLRELGFIDEDRLAWCLAEMIQAPVLNLNNVFIDPKVLQKIPRERCEQLKVLPISVIEDTLTLAMADPFDVTAYDLAQRLARMPVRVVVATESSILKALEKHTDDELGLEEAIRKIPGLDMGSEDELGLDQQDQDYQKAVAQALEDFRKEGQNRPVIRLVNSIIRDAIKMRASDIHIEPMETSCMVRYRIDGLLRNIVSMPAFLHPRNVCRIKILGRMDIAEHRLPQDGSCRVRFQGNELDLRISTMPTQHGEKVVIRVLNRQEAQIRLESMGLLPDSLAQVEKMLRMAQGIILLTGPTGSGKTSTLYAMLHRLKGEHFNIVTLEDPIEYNVPGITQTQVQEKAGFTFAAGFRSILRQDPDVIMVGEIRDEPTADIAFNAAVTGHLVLSTLHTNDSCSVPVRLRELGVSPYLITTGLKGVISQRLVRRLCMHCREPYRPDADICKILGLNPRDPATLYRAVGCKVCGGSGYYGRVGVFEILILSEKMKEMIFAGATGAQLAEQAARDGLRDLMEDAALRVIQGVTSLEEVMRVVPLEERRALCPQCQHRVERYYQTCPFCSFHLWRNLCTTCGKEMEEGWRFCPYCAHQP
ncbi:MAG TPA: ATPase, T2SS/T4P/T4SS family, partial [Candidatus Nitrosotenuis sp.]|nr:ATPase, T2SS/T4P/T4SS family [Candidatus Nitrosotenuis sp.]